MRAVPRLLTPSATAAASDSLLVGVMDIGAEEEAEGEEGMRVLAVGSIEQAKSATDREDWRVNEEANLTVRRRTDADGRQTTGGRSTREDARRRRELRPSSSLCVFLPFLCFRLLLFCVSVRPVACAVLCRAVRRWAALVRGLRLSSRQAAGPPLLPPTNRPACIRCVRVGGGQWLWWQGRRAPVRGSSQLAGPLAPVALPLRLEGSAARLPAARMHA
jgi:hypothetical protein